MRTERVLGLALLVLKVAYQLVKLVDAVQSLTGGATNYRVRRVQA